MNLHCVKAEIGLSVCCGLMQIAFSSISLALQYYVEDMQQGQYRVHHGVVSKQPGSGPNEMGSFQLQDHFAIKTDVPVLGKL